jgi:hypothetical protein
VPPVKHDQPEQENTNIMRQRITIIIGIAALALVATTAALAGTLTTTATITGASGISLNAPATAAFSKVLDGTDQSATYSPAIGIVDARGTGAGWKLTVAATTFSDGTHTLAPGTITGATQACHAGSSCTAASNSITGYPLTLGTTAASVFNAALLSGLGQIDLTPTFSVAIPGNAYAGTYTSTVTLAATTGP